MNDYQVGLMSREPITVIGVWESIALDQILRNTILGKFVLFDGLLRVLFVLSWSLRDLQHVPLPNWVAWPCSAKSGARHRRLCLTLPLMKARSEGRQAAEIDINAKGITEKEFSRLPLLEEKKWDQVTCKAMRAATSRNLQGRTKVFAQYALSMLLFLAMNILMKPRRWGSNVYRLQEVAA